MATIQDNTQLKRLPHEPEIDTITSAGYQVQVSNKIEDPEWDTFLVRTSGGHHVQTSLWARVKAPLGWQAVRLIVKRREEIVAGAQVLIRPIPLAGTVGYVSKGPIFVENDPLLVEFVINELKRLAKTYRIQNLIVQPPDNGQSLAEQLTDWGFQPSPIKLGLSATVLLDLTPDLDTILAQMKSKTRYNIRLGQRKEISVREGTEHDLPMFYQLLMSTGQRQNFSSNSAEYFLEMWRIFNPRGYFKLFLAEYQNEAVSALLAIPFGDTVIYKRGAWSGRYGKFRPNEVMHWTAIEWAKSQGYRYYNFEGIDPNAAEALIRGESIPDSASQTVTRFKVGFGGQVMLLPDTYNYVYNPLLNWSYRTAYPKLIIWPVVERIKNRFRNR